ncbi:MAG TPA: DNA repair protein RecO [Coxiellaceae bacterium]|nr:DNA repair protein RecO [Coxiellaceae bacterium]
MERVDKEKVFILHRRPYRNTSFILELFSERHGRVAVVAKSARGPKSRYRSQLELFTPLLVSWSGRGELKHLGYVELQPLSVSLAGKALLCAFYLNELLLKLLQPHDAHSDLFHYYQQTLLHLSASQETIEPGLRLFEKHLLDELGYGLNLREDAEGRSIEPTAFYRYFSGRDFVRVEEAQEHDYPGKILLALGQGVFIEDSLKIIKRLMRQALHEHLGHQPLMSRELLK